VNGITNGAFPAPVLPNGRSSVRISGVMERELEPIAGFPLRRAVLGILLEAGTALTGRFRAPHPLLCFTSFRIRTRRGDSVRRTAQATGIPPPPTRIEIGKK
ncbi:MAG: hypothetical protein KDB06_09095, partial [Ilumatobacter sp.]|nr:hypothetical protein [Ilumatobacter sp.]